MSRTRLAALLLLSPCLALAGPTFVNVAGAAGVAAIGSGNDCAFLDYDRDGFLDVYFVDHPWGGGGFYRNDGDGTFTSVSVGVSGVGNLIAPADFDHDGWTDLLMSFQGNVKLYRNTHGGFADVTAASGVTHTDMYFGVCWGDYDGDAYPDLFAATTPVLYRNNGDCTFTDVTAAAGIAFPPEQNDARFLDYDRDGRDDIFIAPYQRNCMLYRNNGDGSFTDVSAAAGVDVFTNDPRLAVADVNNDAHPDVYVYLGASDNMLFVSNGDGTFTEAAVAWGVRTTANWGHYDCAFLDCDCDGDADLFADGGRYGGNNFFRNDGDHFVDVTAESGLSNTDDAHAIAVGDYDNDGDPDIYEVCFTGYGSPANKLYRNDYGPPPPLYAFPLGPGWNMVGYAREGCAPTLLADCAIAFGGARYGWQSAIDAGLVHTWLFYYEPLLGYRVLAAEAPRDDDAFRCGRGYWLLAYVDGLSLLIPR